MPAGRRGAAGIGRANKKRVKSLTQSRVSPATQTKDNKEEAGTRPAARSDTPNTSKPEAYTANG